MSTQRGKVKRLTYRMKRVKVLTLSVERVKLLTQRKGKVKRLTYKKATYNGRVKVLTLSVETVKLPTQRNGSRTFRSSCTVASNGERRTKKAKQQIELLSSAASHEQCHPAKL